MNTRKLQDALLVLALMAVFALIGVMAAIEATS